MSEKKRTYTQPTSGQTRESLEKHWGNHARQLYKEYEKGELSWEDYQKEETNLISQMPGFLQESMVADRNAYQESLNAKLNDPAFMEAYGRDPWSRKGLKELSKTGIHVPLGYAQQGRMLPGMSSAYIRRDNLLDTQNRKAIFSGFYRGRKDNSDWVLRHEGSHIPQVGLNEEKVVRAMDALYDPEGGLARYQMRYGPDSDPNEWSNFSHAMNLSKKYDDDPKDTYGPESLRTARHIPPDDPRLAGLSRDERFALLNAAGTFDEIHPTRGMRRSLPGDTLWGDFTRFIENKLTGPNEYLKSMRRWTETPTNERELP